MKHSKLITVTALATFFAFAHCCVASDLTTITFGDTSHDIGNKGPFQENGFQYQAFGESWALINTNLWEHGGDGTVLFSFFGIFPFVGNELTFQRLDGDPFLFQSLELRGRLEGARNTVIIAHGLLNGIEVASQTLQSSNETWRVELANPSFLNSIDQLRLQVVEVNGAALIMDNFVFTSVPEPNTFALLSLAMFGIGFLKYGKSRK